MNDTSRNGEALNFLPETDRTNDYIAVAFIVLITSTGILINLWNICYYRRDPQLITFFIRTRIMSDLIASSVFLIYVVPVILFALKDVHSGYWNRVFALLACWSYMSIVMLEPIVATNRFVAIFFPIHYEWIFTKTLTLTCIVAALILATGSFMPDLFGNECVYFFDYTTLAWGYPKSECGGIAETFAFLLPCYICNGATFIINLITVSRLVILNCASKQTQPGGRENVHIRFFIQSCTQFFIFLIDLGMSSFFAAPQSRLLSFIYYTLIWTSLHTIDGFIIYFFRSKSVKSSKDWRASITQITTKF